MRLSDSQAPVGAAAFRALVFLPAVLLSAAMVVEDGRQGLLETALRRDSASKGAAHLDLLNISKVELSHAGNGLHWGADWREGPQNASAAKPAVAKSEPPKAEAEPEPDPWKRGQTCARRGSTVAAATMGFALLHTGALRNVVLISI